MPDIPVWNKCDNRCVMCANAPGFSGAAGVRYRLKAQIKRFERYLAGDKKAYLKNADLPGVLNLTGGEPTLNPDLLGLLAYFRRRGPEIRLTLLSNGRNFADREFASRILRAAGAPFTAAIALHGPDAGTHDRVAGKSGSFLRTLGGLRNLLALAGPGQEIEIRLVLHRENVARLGDILRFLRKTFPDTADYRVVAMHYEPEGAALKNAARLELRLSDSARAVNRAAPLIRKFGRFRLYHFPLCLIDKALRRYCMVTLPPEDRGYAAVCGKCVLRGECGGLMSGYRARFGADELRLAGKRVQRSLRL